MTITKNNTKKIVCSSRRVRKAIRSLPLQHRPAMVLAYCTFLMNLKTKCIIMLKALINI